MVARAVPALIAELASLLPESIEGSYFVQVTDAYPSAPYVIFSDPESDPSVLDPDLTLPAETTMSRVYVSIVDTTAGNVIDSRDKIRNAFNPGGYGRQVSGAFVKRVVEECSPIMEDRDNPLDDRGAYPSFAVDVYKVVT